MTRHRRTIALATALAACLLLQAPGAAQFGGFGIAANQRLRIVEQYDRDGDGRLNRAERDVARAAIAGVGGARRGASFRTQTAGTPTPGPRLVPSDVQPPYPSGRLYDPRALRTIFLEFEHDDWEEELAAFYDTDVQVPATMTVDGTTYRDVGIRFRGASSFMFVSAGFKRSLRVAVNFGERDQHLDGYRILNLNNSVNDPTFLRTFLYSEIAPRYVPVAKVNFAQVAINGESWGIYINQQQFDAGFIEEWFDGRRGARWKAPGSPAGRAGLEYLGDAIAPYRDLFEIDTRDDDESWEALIELTRVLNETPLDRLEAALAPIFDVDGALKFLAVEMALANSDGYWTRASDYNLFRDADGRFHVIPHDINEGFMDGGGGRGGGRGGRGRGGGGPGDGGTDLDPLVGLDDPTKPLRSRLLAVPALRERYLGYVYEIAERQLDWTAMRPLIQDVHARIAPVVRTDTKKTSDLAGFQAAVAETGNPLKTFFDRRRAYLLNHKAQR